MAPCFGANSAVLGGGLSWLQGNSQYPKKNHFGGVIVCSFSLALRAFFSSGCSAGDGCVGHVDGIFPLLLFRECSASHAGAHNLQLYRIRAWCVSLPPLHPDLRIWSRVRSRCGPRGALFFLSFLAIGQLSPCVVYYKCLSFVGPSCSVLTLVKALLLLRLTGSSPSMLAIAFFVFGPSLSVLANY